MNLLLQFLSLALAAYGQSITLVAFTGDSDTTHRFTELNDPVMGGRSNGTWKVSSSGYGILDGYVKTVPSLSAPGFIEAWANDGNYNDASAAGADGYLVMTVRSSTPEYTGFRVTLASGALSTNFACAAGGSIAGSRGCFKSHFTVPESNGAWVKVQVPLQSFTDKWSSATGDPTTTCSEDSSCCLTTKNLKKIQAMGFWGEGKLGHVNLEVQKVEIVSASDISDAHYVQSYLADGRPPKQYDQCQGPVQMNLRFNISSLGPESLNAPVAVNPDEGVASAICCDSRTTPFAEPQFVYQSPYINLYKYLPENGPTIFYDSVCGIPLFKAPVGRSLADFKKDTDEHGWPSFRAEEVVSANIVTHKDTGFVYSKCGTHLGSYLPDSDGDRWCIDLSCIAGNPPSDGRFLGGWNDVLA